jgi:hypothetical protein
MLGKGLRGAENAAHPSQAGIPLIDLSAASHPSEEIVRFVRGRAAQIRGVGAVTPAPGCFQAMRTYGTERSHPAEFGVHPGDEPPMTIRGGGNPSASMAAEPRCGMGPPPRSFAPDAHGCIMVRSHPRSPNARLRRDDPRHR